MRARAPRGYFLLSPQLAFVAEYVLDATLRVESFHILFADFAHIAIEICDKSLSAIAIGDLAVLMSFHGTRPLPLKASRVLCDPFRGSDEGGCSRRLRDLMHSENLLGVRRGPG